MRTAIGRLMPYFAVLVLVSNGRAQEPDPASGVVAIYKKYVVNPKVLLGKHS